MTINIGGERITLNVPFTSQNEVRDAENYAAALYDDLRLKFPQRNSANILARVAYNLSAQLVEAQNIINQASAMAENCEMALADIMAADETSAIHDV